MFQMKEQDKTSEKRKKTLNEMEISNLPDREFTTVVIKMLTELRRIMDEHSENFSKEMESIESTK